MLIEKEGVWGCTFVGECTRVCPKHVDPAGAIQRYKLKAATENLRRFCFPGVRDERLLTTGAGVQVVVAEEADLLPLVMRAQQRFRGVVRGVSDDDGLCHRAWRGVYQKFLTGPRHPS